MGTSQVRCVHFLRNISNSLAEALVEEWANSETMYPTEALRPFSNETREQIVRTDAAILRFMKKYPDVFGELPPIPAYSDKVQSIVSTSQWQSVARVQRYLRLAWQSRDLREREWQIFQARVEYHHNTVLVPLWSARMRASKDIQGDINVDTLSKRMQCVSVRRDGRLLNKRCITCRRSPGGCAAVQMQSVQHRTSSR